MVSPATALSGHRQDPADIFNAEAKFCYLILFILHTLVCVVMAAILSDFLVTLFLWVLVMTWRVDSEPVQDKQALLGFLAQTPHARRLRWTNSTSACDWVGVVCDTNRSFVYSLRLPGANLIGPIPPNTLGQLSQLRVLSLRSNRLSGELPSDFSSLTLLRSIYLQSNRFSGNFPAALTRLTRLNRLDLSSNNFTGSVPFSVNNLTHLTGMFLQNNSFSGNLPSINPGNLQEFNVSNNNLNGSIPASLAGFPASAFTGNLDLCGAPLPSCDRPFFPSLAPSPSAPTPLGKKSKGLSTAAIVGIVLGSILAALSLLVCLIICWRRQRQQQPSKQQKPMAVPRAVDVGEAGTSSSKDDITGGSMEVERNKLVFLEGAAYSFDLEDLLRASAEVLGKGSVGTSYKAILEEGTTVVVKRLKDVVASKKEFEMQMDILGKIRHENVVPLRAFYFSRDEKLIVTDYLRDGSLSALLHGSRGTGRTPLDWDNRLRIAFSAARGLTYLHVSGKVVHGNIKSSNVLLRPEYDACISDFGLNPLFGNAAPATRVAGYRAPEVFETRKVSFNSDVYSFGVLLLELLTGKAPNQASVGDQGIDLPRWVQSVVREEWTAEVFDAELITHRNVEEEMVQLLQIAMACVSTVPDQRPDMADVLRMVEDMNRGETDDGLRQSSDDPSKGSDAQTPPTGSRTTPRSDTP